MSIAYLTPLDLAVLAWPASIQPIELGPARRGLTAFTGTGTSQIIITGTAFDAHTVVVQYSSASSGQWRYQTDGATWSGWLRWDPTVLETPLLHTAADELTGGADTGLRVSFTSGTPANGDQWSVSTQPIQAIQAAILACTARAALKLGARSQAVLSMPDVGVKSNVAVLVRLALAERRGLDPASADGRLYIDSAARAMAELIDIAKGLDALPQGMGEGPIYTPDCYPGADRGGIATAHRARGGAR